MQQTKQIKLAQHSAEDLQRAIAGKSELYEAVQRNGCYLPKMKASIITEQYITNVNNRRQVCRAFAQIKLLPKRQAAVLLRVSVNWSVKLAPYRR